MKEPTEAVPPTPRTIDRTSCTERHIRRIAARADAPHAAPVAKCRNAPGSGGPTGGLICQKER